MNSYGVLQGPDLSQFHDDGVSSDRRDEATILPNGP